MLRHRKTILACVVEYARDCRITVLLPFPESQVVVLGALTGALNVYPFLDLPRHLRHLGLDQRTAATYTDGLIAGWCVLCIDGPRAESPAGEDPPYPLRHWTMVPASGQPSLQARFDP